MAKPQHRKELEKAIRSLIRLRFSVMAERQIQLELDKLDAAEASGQDYNFDVDEVLHGIGVPQGPPALNG